MAEVVLTRDGIVNEWFQVMKHVVRTAPPETYRRNCLGLVLDSIPLCVLPIPEDADQMARINEYGTHLIAQRTEAQGGK